MQYHQKQYPFYNPTLIRMSMGTSDFIVNYADMLDQTCVEFLHTHEDCYEIYYCLDGTQNLMVADECCTLTGGSFVVIRPGVHHYTIYEPHTPKHYVVFVFTPPTVSTARSKSRSAPHESDFVISALHYFDERTHFSGCDRFHSRAVLDRLHEEITNSYSGTSLMVSALYQQYLISILRCLMAEDPQQQQPQPAPSNINLAVAITKYMHANYHKNISIQDISDTFYISPRHVNRVFEDYFGQSFKRTLNIYRLNYAKNYLLDTDFSTEKISGLVGLSSPKMLYQLFKEIEGMTISEFRAQHPGRRTFPSAGEPDAYKASDALS